MGGESHLLIKEASLEGLSSESFGVPGAQVKWESTFRLENTDEEYDRDIENNYEERDHEDAGDEALGNNTTGDNVGVVNEIMGDVETSAFQYVRAGMNRGGGDKREFHNFPQEAPHLAVREGSGLFHGVSEFRAPLTAGMSLFYQLNSNNAVFSLRNPAHHLNSADLDNPLRSSRSPSSTSFIPAQKK